MINWRNLKKRQLSFISVFENLRIPNIQILYNFIYNFTITIPPLPPFNYAWTESMKRIVFIRVSSIKPLFEIYSLFNMWHYNDDVISDS